MPKAVEHWITCREFAELAGVGSPAIQAAGRCRTLEHATKQTRGARWLVDTAHPDAVAYLQRARSRANRSVGPLLSAADLEGDPFILAARLAASGGVRGPAVAAVNSPKALASLTAPNSPAVESVAAELQVSNVFDLGALTLREAADKYGGFPAMSDIMRAQKLRAETRLKEQQAATARGELVPRALVSGTFAPLVDGAFKRCVTEAPEALAQQVVAMVRSKGTDSAEADVAALIRRDLGRILGDVRDTVHKSLAGLEL